MPFTLGVATSIYGVANSRRVTGTGNLTDFATTINTIGAPFAATWNGNTLTITGGGTDRIIVMEGTLIEERVGVHNVLIDNRAWVCWGNSTTSQVTTASAALAGSTTITVASATNLIVGSFLRIGTLVAGGENNGFAYKVTSVSGTTVTLNTGLGSAITAGTTVTVVGSSTLGLKSAIGTYTSVVEVTYTSSSLPAYTKGTDPLAANNPELCFVGNYGVMNHVSGSFAISNSNGRNDYDNYRTSYTYNDNVVLGSMTTINSWQHFFYAGSTGYLSTSKTIFLKNNSSGGGVLEAGGVSPTKDIPPLAVVGTGVGWTSGSGFNLPDGTYTITKPQYFNVGFAMFIPFTGTGQANLKIFDSAYYYVAPSTYGTWTSGVPSFEIFRTFNFNWRDPFTNSIASSGVPAKLIAIGGSAGSTGTSQNYTTTPYSATFTSASTSVVLRQSWKPQNTNYTFNGVSTQTGFTDDANYNIYLVSYGYANQTLNTSAKPATSTAVSIDGITINSVSSQNALAVAVAYASVATAPFSFSTTGNGTLTISANCTTDQIGQYLLKLAYDNADQAFWRNLLHNPATVNGIYCDIGSINVVINTGVTVSAGTVTTGLKTSQSITLNGTAIISAVYQTSVGTSTVLRLTVPSSGSSMCIFKTDGTTKYFGNNLTAGNFTVYFSPTETGTYHFVYENYGKKRVEDLLSINGGSRGYVPTEVDDVGITESTKATVAAYTTLTTTSQIYDATAYFRLSEAGIKLGQLVNRDGTYLDFGSFNVKLKDDATDVVGVSSGTITYKSIVINSTSKYNAMKATPPATITPTDTEIINVLIEDANGDSKITILGGDDIGYQMWKVPTTTATDDYATGTLLTTLPNNHTPFRFIGISGFDIVGRDISSGVRRRSSMLKGSYEQAFYVGAQIQLASDAPQLVDTNNKIDELILKVDTNLDAKVSTRLADADYIEAPTTSDIWNAPTRTLTSAGSSGATLAEIEASTILAKEATSQSIKSKVDSLNNTDISTLSKKADTDLLLKSADYTAPDNAKISDIKTKVDSLENYNDATAQSKLDVIKDKTDTLVNADFTTVNQDLSKIKQGINDVSLFIPTNLT